MPFPRRTLAPLATVYAIVVAMGCGDPNAPSPPRLADIVVARLADSIPVGASVALQAEARTRSGAALDAVDFRFASLDSSVAVVTADGQLTAVDSGDVRVLVRARRDADSLLKFLVARVRHVQPLIGRLELQGMPDTVWTGDSLNVRVIPRNDLGRAFPELAVTMTTPDSARLRLVAPLRFAALDTGLARIVLSATARYVRTETLTVHVRRKPASVGLVLPDTAYIGSTPIRLSVTVRDRLGTVIVPTPALTLSSSDPAVATIDSTRTVRALRAGTSWIRVAVRDRPDVVDSVLVRAATFVPFAERRWTSVSAGSVDYDRCGLDAARNLWCTTPRDGDRPLRLATNAPVERLHVGQSAVCGLAADGTMHCLGSNAGGGMGLGVTTGRFTTFQPGGAGRRWSVLANGEHRAACGIQAADSVLYCWGHNDFSQVGRPGPADDPRILPTEPAIRARAVTVSVLSACAITIEGALWCWGYTAPFGTGDRPSAPREVAPAGSYVDVAMSSDAVCGLAADGVAWCRGWTTDAAFRHVPIRVESPVPFARIYGSYDTMFCGLTADGAAWCWPSTAATSYAATPRLPGERFTRLALGWYSSCGLTTDGRAPCWMLIPPITTEPAPSALRLAPTGVRALQH